jgi:hypothetical protein
MDLREIGAAGIAQSVWRLCYWLDDRSSILGGGNEGICSHHHRVQTGSGAHPASYPVGTGDFFLGVKRPGREADHSPHLVPRLRVGGSIPPLTHCLHGVMPC